MSWLTNLFGRNECDGQRDADADAAADQAPVSIEAARQARARMEAQTAHRRREVAGTRLEQMHIRHHIRTGNPIEHDLFPSLQEPRKDHR